MRIPFRHGETILHFAARRNWTALCRWLLRLGAEINQSDILGRTALHYAVRDDATDAARLLIARGADLDAKDWQGHTPLELAEAGGGKTAAVIREEFSLRNARKVKEVRLSKAAKRRDAG